MSSASERKSCGLSGVSSSSTASICPSFRWPHSCVCVCGGGGIKRETSSSKELQSAAGYSECEFCCRTVLQVGRPSTAEGLRRTHQHTMHWAYTVAARLPSLTNTDTKHIHKLTHSTCYPTSLVRCVLHVGALRTSGTWRKLVPMCEYSCTPQNPSNTPVLHPAHTLHAVTNNNMQTTT